MFEEMTFENILYRALENVSSDVDKRQGSVIFDAIAPVCAEIAQLYISLNNVLDSAFADTAPREYLILKAKEIGLEPYPATKARCKGIFNMAVPIGSRFNIDKINFEVTEKLDSEGFEYILVCEEEGTEGNKHIGNMIPVDYINGLTTAKLTEVLVYGEDEEDTEVFRQRYLDKLTNTPFGGNKADYSNWLKAFDGVGMAKAERGGSGKVNVYITTPDMTTPSTELLAEIKESLDPKAQEGLGAGIVPIGHIVTVMAAQKTPLNISVTLKLKDGYTSDGIKTTIKERFEEILKEMNKAWEKDSVTIYSAQLLVDFIKINGIENISSLTINEKSYVSLESNALGTAGEVEVSVSD